MYQFSDEELMSYADGEADAITEARIDKQLINDISLQDRLTVFTQTTDLLSPLKTALSEEIPPAIQRSLNTISPIEPSKEPSKKTQRLSMSLVASVTLCIGLGLGFLTGNSNINTPADGILQAGLPNALDQQMSGMPLLVEVNHSSYEIMPLGTYKNAQEQYCRRFELTHLPSYTRMGLACKADDGAWDIQLLLPSGVMQTLRNQEGVYNTASSGSALVKSTLATMGFNQIVSTSEESDLIKQQWQR